MGGNYQVKMRAGYRAELTGREVYELLQLLEQHAVGTESYLEVAKCVVLAERLRNQVEKQGWGKDSPSRAKLEI
jgi:hypothetical protein